MIKRNYKLKDIYDYLLEHYNLEWRLYLIRDDGKERGVRNFDFYGKDSNRLMVVAYVYSGSQRKSVSLNVSNDSLKVYEINPHLHHYAKPEVEWNDFLKQRIKQEQGLNK